MNELDSDSGTVGSGGGSDSGVGILRREELNNWPEPSTPQEQEDLANTTLSGTERTRESPSASGS